MATTETDAFNLALQRLLSTPQQHPSSMEIPFNVSNSSGTDSPAQLAAVRIQIIQLAAQSKALALAAHATRCDVARSAVLHEAATGDAAASNPFNNAVGESTAVLESAIEGTPWGHTG